ncbi:MAG TPA: ATP-binding protein, partial [Polyangiaceae bacterium]|nr:ATP-binding protein [Polyangiaceae bacterium]
MASPLDLPPVPRGLKGRRTELSTLSKTIIATAPARLALIGAGGSGKSMLANALAHQLARFFEGQVSWFRVGSWDFYTLTEMLALRFGVTGGDGRVARLNAFFARTGPRLIVLDNHEDDRAMARLLDAFASAPVSFVITARRCLLAGVLIFPVTAPLVTAGRSAFPRVARLTRMLRWNPLALDIADGIVASRAASVAQLAEFLEERGVQRVRAVEHEDDLPEIALLVDWAWRRLTPPSRRILAVLAHIEGDHVDLASLATLAKIRGKLAAGLELLRRWRLVQEPVGDRY